MSETTSVATPDTSAALAAELADAKARIEHLEGELRRATVDRDAVTRERRAMWHDYCRLREALLKAFPDIPDPADKQAVKDVIDAGQSH
jgi:hypothetical protein